MQIQEPRREVGAPGPPPPPPGTGPKPAPDPLVPPSEPLMPPSEPPAPAPEPLTPPSEPLSDWITAAGGPFVFAAPGCARRYFFREDVWAR